MKRMEKVEEEGERDGYERRVYKRLELVVEVLGVVGVVVIGTLGLLGTDSGRLSSVTSIVGSLLATRL